MSLRLGVVVALASLLLAGLLVPTGATATVHRAPAPWARTLTDVARTGPPMPLAPLPSAVDARPSVPASGPAATAPTFLWSTAQILYGPGDPETLLFGEGSVMGADNAIGNTSTFGGLATGGLSNISLVYDNGTLGYWWYATSPTSPSPRANASYGVDSATGVGFLFGGLTRLPNRLVSNETWTYDYPSEHWTNVTGATAPPPRENAAFAVDPDLGLGLLEGGIDPNFVSGSGSGTLLWNDTWAINLTTHRWTALGLSVTPPARYGSQMVWDPVLGAFLLFGGCDESRCTNELWSFTPGATAWVPVSAGTPPSARGSSSFVWDPVDNVSLLFGGFVPGPTGPQAVGDAYYLDAAADAWNQIYASNPPAPAFGAGSTFSDYSGCVGMWVEGGSPATAGVIENVSMLQPYAESLPSCYNPIGGSTGGGPPAYCSNTSAHVSVAVRDARTQAGVAGAQVTVVGTCGRSAGVTNAAGYANLSEASPDILTITATAVGYHPGQVSNVAYTGVPGAVTVLELDALPALSVRVLGTTVAGTAPLANVTISADEGLVLGSTGGDGWLNVSTVATTSAQEDIEASTPGFSSANATVAIPYTGVAFANFTLDAFGALHVHIVDAQSGAGIPDATFLLGFVSGLGANATELAVDGLGWWNDSRQAGTYTVLASAPGYLPPLNATDVTLPWVATVTVVVALTAATGATVDVHLLDASSGVGVPNGSVSFGDRPPIAALPNGWANASALGPPGLLRISAGAAGYFPNSTTVVIGPIGILPDVVVNLTAAPPCSPYRACLPAAATAPPLLDLVPPSGPTRFLLLAAPILLGIVGVAVLFRGRRAAPSASPPSRAGSRGI